MVEKVIGKRNKEGELLVLGGWQEDLYRTPAGKFRVGSELLKTSEEGVTAYNRANETNLKTDYFEKYFKPWYKKKYGGKKVLTVESSSGKGTYDVVVDEYGTLTCTCPGFRYRGKCKHSDIVKALLKGER